MKIWIVEISDFLPKIDGENRLYRAGMLAEALVKAGHQVLWWTSTFNHQLRRQRYDASSTIDIQKNYRLRLLYGPGYKRSISFGRWKHNRAVAKEFAREMKEIGTDGQPDIVYACLPTLEVCEQAVLYGIQHDVPVVVDIRDPWPDIYLSLLPRFIRSFSRNTLLRSEFLRAYRILNQATAIISGSFAYLKWGLKIAGRKAGIWDKQFFLGAEIKSDTSFSLDEIKSIPVLERLSMCKPALIITFIGSFSRSFNFKTVIEAARDLTQKGRGDIHFLIVGDGQQNGYLRNHTRDFKNIHLIGWSKKSIVDKILTISSIGLAPYSSAVAPALSNKPFEYMSAGLPLLSSNGGELEALIEQESIGLQYNADDPSDLKDKIMWFLSHPEETKAMGKRAKALFEKKYNADIVYADLVKHLEKIVSERAPKK